MRAAGRIGYSESNAPAARTRSGAEPKELSPLTESTLAEREVEVVGAEPTLEELAATANQEHGFAIDAAGAALRHAIRSGEALLAARERVPNREWSRWLSDHIPFSGKAASTYMRLAHYQEYVTAGEHSSIESARLSLRWLPVVRDHKRQRVQYPPETSKQACELREDGATFSEITAITGCSESTVRRMVIPGEAERHREKVNRAAIEARSKRQAAKERRRSQAVRKIGGSVAKSYSGLRITLDEMQRAHDEAESREVKAALGAAMSKLHDAEDQIVRALGIA